MPFAAGFVGDSELRAEPNRAGFGQGRNERTGGMPTDSPSESRSVDREIMTVGRSSLSSFAESDDGHGQIKVVKPNDALKLRRLIGRAAGRSRGLLRDRGRGKNDQRGDRSKRLQDIRKTH